MIIITTVMITSFVMYKCDIQSVEIVSSTHCYPLGHCVAQLLAPNRTSSATPADRIETCTIDI